MQAPSPWIPAAGAGAAEVLAATIPSHANAGAARSQRVQSSVDGVSQAPPDSMEEQRMGALMEDSVSVGGRSGSGHDNKEAQEWSVVSARRARGGGVVPSSPPSQPSSDRSSECVEPQGALLRSFPLGSRPPATPSAWWRMRRDSR